MVHMNAQNDHDHGGNYVTNHPHNHVFFLLGDETIFGVHMTQYHCEIHKYQLILKLKLPDAAKAKLQQLRREYPDDSFILGNVETSEFPDIAEMTVPDLASGATPTFTGHIFQGLRPLSEEEMQVPHFYPWQHTRCSPAIAKIEVAVERVVMFRPFMHHQDRPPYASYFLWGEGGEAHMTNLQTASLATGPFEPEGFGPDFDNIMSLARAPDWLDPALLKAGICVSTPAIDMYDFDTWKTEAVFPEGSQITTLYRGIGPARSVTAGKTYLNATAVCNSAGFWPDGKICLFMSDMPPGYYVDP